MNRLTWKAYIDAFEDVGLQKGITVGDAICKLAAYEDTGLTPEEIAAMKAEYSDTFQAHLNELLDIKDKRIAELEAENKRLHALVDNIECVMRGENNE